MTGPDEAATDAAEVGDAAPKVGTGTGTGTAATRARRAKVLALGILPALLLIVAMIAGFLKYVDATQRGEQRAGIEAVEVAKSTAVQMLSYTPENVRQRLKAARELLTGGFRSRYAVLADNVVIPGAQSQQITAVATVPAAAVVSADDRQAVVLLFVDQKVTVGAQAPTVTTSSVRATLTRQQGHWLVSDFSPN